MNVDAAETGTSPAARIVRRRAAGRAVHRLRRHSPASRTLSGPRARRKMSPRSLPSRSGADGSGGMVRPGGRLVYSTCTVRAGGEWGRRPPLPGTDAGLGAGCIMDGLPCSGRAGRSDAEEPSRHAAGAAAGCRDRRLLHCLSAACGRTEEPDAERNNAIEQAYSRIDHTVARWDDAVLLVTEEGIQFRYNHVLFCECVWRLYFKSMESLLLLFNSISSRSIPPAFH